MRSPNPKIYGHVERFVPIEVNGQVFEVPDGIPLIRAFQYIQFELDGLVCDWTLFCFNDTIGCCDCTLTPPGASAPEPGRACCVRVAPGLRVDVLPEGCRLSPPATEEPAP